MISQPRSSMNSWTFASISRSRTPGFSHSYLIFHIAASPMLDACFSSSISSRVFTVRAFETVGQPSTILMPVCWNASSAGVSNVDVVFPVALVRRGGVADVGARKQHQRAQIVSLHLLAETRQTLGAQPIEIHAVLPVGAGLAVQTARVPLVRPADETDVHARCFVDNFAHVIRVLPKGTRNIHQGLHIAD